MRVKYNYLGDKKKKYKKKSIGWTKYKKKTLDGPKKRTHKCILEN